MGGLFPIRSPRVGVAFTEEAVCLVEVSPWPFARRIPRIVATQALPPGLLSAHPSTLNLSDTAEMTKVTRALLQRTRQRTVAVSLPVSSAQVGLFAFEDLSDREEDRFKVLRWRFEREAHVAVGHAEVCYRVYRPGGHQRHGLMSYVLAVAIQRPILSQYEQMLEEAGAVPISIGWGGLHLCELCRGVTSMARDVFMVEEGARTLTVLGLREGVPVFFRMSTGHSNRSDRTGEIIRTLQYYDDLFPHVTDQADREHALVYRLSNGPLGDHTTAEETDEALFTVPVGRGQWTVHVRRPRLSMLVPKDVTFGTTAEWSAFACAMGM